MRLDIADYRSLRAHLDTQFHAALRHESERLIDIAAQITALVDTLELRRQERTMLSCMLVSDDQPATMESVMQRLAGHARVIVATYRRTLETLVSECRQAIERNSGLLIDQRNTMRRILRWEADTHAPA